MKLAFVFGTRPEIIKLSPLFRASEKAGIDYILIHTNQHYSHELDAIFFDELQLPNPHYNLNVGAGTQTAQTARMMMALEEVLTKEQPTHVLVQGDTNSVLAGALVAAKLQIPIAHIEAGLRSNDWAMPEEINRIITDHISSFLFPPTKDSAALLAKEGIPDSKIHTVGNTAVDAVLHTASIVSEESLTTFSLLPKQFCLLTLHRPSNVDMREDLLEVMSFLEKAYEKIRVPFFFPAHPRTKAALERFSIPLPSFITLHEPVGYAEMVTLQKFAQFVFTDSGGLQEESCVLRTPCFTLRENTERPESVTVGANIVVGRSYEKFLQGLSHFATHTTWENPFGTGNTSALILEVLRENPSLPD